MIKKIFRQYKEMSVVAKAAIWFVFCTILQKGIAFITVPIFTRIMPTEEYGMYSTFLSWYSIITILGTLNMHSCVYSNTLVKKENDREKDEDAVSMLSLSAVITIVLFTTYLVFHKFFNRIIGLPTFLVSLIFAEVLFDPPVSFWSIKQRFEYKYIKLVIRTIMMTICNAGFGICFVLLSKNNQAIARACSIVLVQFIFGGFFYIYFFKRGKKIFSTHGWKHFLSVQLPLLPHSLSLTILGSSDKIMISNMIGKTQTAIYSVAYSAGFVVSVIKNSIVDAIRPWIYQKIKQKDYKSIRRNMNTIMILITLLSIVFTAFAPEIIYIMAPPQYYEAIYAIPPVAASSFFTFLYNIFSNVGLYFEKTKKIMIASVAGATLNLVLNFICIPIWGYIVAAYTTLICYMFFSFAHYCIMRAICKKNLNNARIYDMRFISLMSIVMVLMTILFTFTYKNIYIRYGIIIIVLLIVIIKRKRFIGILKEMNNKNK